MTIVAAKENPVRAAVDSEENWQQSVRGAIRDPCQLCAELALPASLASAAAAEGFPVFVPRPLLSRIARGDPADPILRQVLPVSEETQGVTGFTSDPLNEAAATRLPGLIQKYQHRALLIVSGACAVHCRYCFRREFPYSEGPRSMSEWGPVLADLESDESIHEVLLSGGDPLMLVDHQLDQLLRALDAIPHVRRIRIHSRLPIVIPSRVTDGLLRSLANCRAKVWFAVHVNHPAELDDDVIASWQRLMASGVSLINQTVLLKGVNDHEDTLVELSESLVDNGVLPYYLHQLDPVTGTAHFAVPVERGRELIAAIRGRLPGYAVPRYVQEIAGEPNKVVLG